MSTFALVSSFADIMSSEIVQSMVNTQYLQNVEELVGALA